MVTRLLAFALMLGTFVFAVHLAGDFSLVKAVIGGGIIVTLAGGLVRRRAAAEPFERTYRAYRQAWQQLTGDDAGDSLGSLRECFKQHSAPGAYMDPDGDALAPWISAWRSGLSPRDARRHVKRLQRST